MKPNIRIIFRLCSSFLFVASLQGCATYYQRNLQLNDYIQQGNYTEADKLLDKSPKEAQGNNRVLYYFNRGVTCFNLGNYEKSNQFFRQADYYIEDYTENIGLQALTLVSNPMVKPYRPEDFESVIIHFYMSLNHLFLNDYEGALVECRRVNLQLQQINDRYKANKNKYSLDAFALNLMGLIYEASGDYNNAFIAYRNSYEAYETLYTPLFNIQAPNELKNSLVRSAHLTGFLEEEKFYQDKFNISYSSASDSENGSVVFFWMSGFGPIKSEWQLTFVNNGLQDGYLNLSENDLGLTYPVYIGNKPYREQAQFKNLSLVRVAFPKYTSRVPFYSNATLQVDQDSTYNFELGENIDLIAHQCLNDRLLRELASGIARLATKKALEELARSQDKNLGALISIVNAATEKADTRNWQSLPYSISYARISLPEGIHQLELNAYGQGNDSQKFTIDIKKGQTKFMVFHHL